MEGISNFTVIDYFCEGVLSATAHTLTIFEMQRKVTKNPTTTYHPLYHSTLAVNIVGTNCTHIKQALIAERWSLHELAGMEKGP